MLYQKGERKRGRAGERERGESALEIYRGRSSNVWLNIYLHVSEAGKEPLESSERTMTRVGIDYIPAIQSRKTLNIRNVEYNPQKGIILVVKLN